MSHHTLIQVLNSGIMLTVEEALDIQAEQLAHYEGQCPGITEKVKAVTYPLQLEPGVPYPVDEVNRWIPRGAQIEYVMQTMARKG